MTLFETCTVWDEAIALPGIDSTTVAEPLVNIYARLGFPEHELIDSGSEFRRKLMEEVFRVFQTQNIHTSTYHAQSNELVERFNGTLDVNSEEVSPGKA